LIQNSKTFIGLVAKRASLHKTSFYADHTEIHIESLLLLTSVEPFANSPVLIKANVNSVALVIMTPCPTKFTEAGIIQLSNLIQLEPTGRYSTLVQKSVNPQEVKHE
jgi:hypothetical protein